MLQTPINVVPSNGQVRTVGEHLHTQFNFQGDLLTFVQGEIADMEFLGDPSSGTNQYVAWYNMPDQGHLSVIHNGQQVNYIDNGWWSSFAKAEHNYKHRLRLFQHYPEGMSSGGTNIAGRPMPDMYYARGKVYQKSYGAYSNQSAYARGDVCTNSGNTYACNTAITKEDGADYNSDGANFVAAHWTRVYNYQTVIEPDLENIKAPFYYQWNTSEGGETVTHKILLGAIYMDIMYERHMISAYDKTTGIVSFQKVTFNPNIVSYTAQEITDIQDDTLSYTSEFAITKHGVYKMYVNYLETGWYDFKWRSAPTISTYIDPSVAYSEATDAEKKGVEAGISCRGTYAQSEAVGLKWYQYQLYAFNAKEYSSSSTYTVNTLAVYNHNLYKCINPISTPENFHPQKWQLVSFESVGTMIDETDRIFSYDLQTGFPTHPFTYGYGAKMIVSTQDDDVEYTTYAVGKYDEDNTHDYEYIRFNPRQINGKSYSANDNTQNLNISDSVITFSWNALNQYFFDVFRREVYRDGSLAPFASYLGRVATSTTTETLGYFEFTDYSAANDTTYQYEIIAKNEDIDATTYGRPYCAIYIYNVHVKWDGWRIMSLTPQKDEVNRHFMQVGDEWKFMSDIDSGDITRNITSVLHVGTAAYAKTTRNNTKYESGSFTADLLTVSCPHNEIIDNIERVKAWMNFICGDNPFLLKSAKGDVWVVSIVNSPSRQYDESFNPIFTKVRYEWAESQNKDKCIFY